MNKGIIGGGIGVFVIIAVVFVLFTNVDDVIVSEVVEVTSKVEIDTSTISQITNDYPINNRCDFFMAQGFVSSRDDWVRQKWMNENLSEEKSKEVMHTANIQVNEYLESQNISFCGRAQNDIACYDKLEEIILESMHNSIILPSIYQEYKQIETSEQLANFYEKAYNEFGCIEKIKELQPSFDKEESLEHIRQIRSLG